MKVAVIGAGLAGSDCAWILAEHYGLEVSLFEMKPHKQTPAQISPHLFAELVCSNTFKSKSILNPAGLLKDEIEALGSLVISCAKKTEVPAGEALAVDREVFSGLVTEKLKTHKNIKVIPLVVENIAQILAHDEFVNIVVATGPLTDDSLAADLRKITNNTGLYFYDAIAPIIDGDSIDYSVAFFANRKSFSERKETAKSTQCSEEEQGDYLNLPLNKEEYYNFVERLIAGSKVPHHNFEEPRYFNACQPIEVLAERGPRTLAFGPMKPRGLTDPRTGKMPYAVVQLRKEKQGDSAWNMVGFQTRLTWGAQKEILRTLPGLQNAEFFRMGSMHRNTYFVSPSLLNENFTLKGLEKMYLAGQIMGVEGYLESAAMGTFIAHLIGQRIVKKRELECPPANTSLGCLARYCLFTEAKNFNPMNIHWGLFTDLTEEDIVKFSKNPQALLKLRKLDKMTKREVMAARSQYLYKEWLSCQYL